MKKVALLVSTGMLFLISGCSTNSQKSTSNGAPTVVQASIASVGTSPSAEPAAPLPVLATGPANPQAWRSEIFDDGLGNAITLKGTSLDGKFDFIVLQKGTHSFLSFVRHGRWGSVRNEPAKGKLMYIRVKFEDGREKRVEWDELGFATENLYSVLWSYPIQANAPIGPALEARSERSVGGDQLLLQDMMKHKTMLLEVEPGITTQFDTTGLAQKIESVRTDKTQPVLDARQTVE